MKLIRPVIVVLLLTVVVAPAGAVDRFDSAVRAVTVAADPLEAAARHGLAVRDGRVHVEVVIPNAATSAVEQWLHERGALFVSARRNRMEAFVTPDFLPELERHPDVAFVERPLYAVLPEPAPTAAPVKLGTLAVTSEALEAMNLAQWSAEGLTGNGVRVGIIDVQFGGWEDLLGVELPPADRTTYRAFNGATVSADAVHGTACAEIVHDIAPDAELYLAHIRSLNGLYSALDWFIEQGVDVATMSLGWYGTGPGDGTGETNDELSAFIAAADAPFFSSAGNERRSHWQGQSVDDNGDDWVEFSPGDDLNSLTYTISAGDSVGAYLTWNDWDSPTADYSLHLYNLDGDVPVEVATSNRPQNGQGWQTPFESISYTADEGGRFGVKINRAGVVGTHDLEIFSPDSDLEIRVAEGSITVPSDSEDVIAVAAIAYSGSFAYRSFSSAGPTNGPGGSFDGGFVAPDLSGYDGVSTASYGPGGFYGTSAASPHTAGAAAVVRDADPMMNHLEVRQFLEDRAIELGAAGKDNDYGWGRLFLGQSPGSNCTFSFDPVGAEVGVAGGGGIIRMTADEGCPWSTSSGVDWITVLPATGSGSSSIGYTVAANDGPPRTGFITIANQIFTVNQAGMEPMSTWAVAGIAETEGLGETRWKSDLAILNPESQEAAIDLVYRHDGVEEVASMTVGGGEVTELVNVAVDTFGVPDSSGVVEVQSRTELIVTSRTYNDTPEGTFGQFIAGVKGLDGFVSADEAVLSQLAGNDDFRTNIGFVNFGVSGVRARIRLFDGSGAVVGDEISQIVPAADWVQRNRVFHVADAGDCAGCYAVIDFVGVGPLWTYASVVDAQSGDPTTIPMIGAVGSGAVGAERSLVAGIAETDGANETKWKSNLALLNLAGNGVTAELTYRFDSQSASTSVTLADGELVEFSNIAADLFGAPGSAGAVDVEADGALVVTARTFNDAPTGTFGQFLPGFGEASALVPGDAGYLSQLKSTDTYRTNIGYTNYGEAECSVRASLMDANGALLKQIFATVPPGGWIQQNKVFESAGVAPVPIGYAVVNVLTPGCEVWSYASVVDNGSGDPTTVPVVRVN